MWELLSCLVLATSLDTFTWNMKVIVFFLPSNTEEIWEILCIFRGGGDFCCNYKITAVHYKKYSVLQDTVLLWWKQVASSIHSGCIYSLFFLFKVTRRKMNSFWDIFCTFTEQMPVSFLQIKCAKVYFYCLTYIYTIHALFITANTAQLQLYVSDFVVIELYVAVNID